VAGSFYPGDRDKLQRTISSYFTGAGNISGEFNDRRAIGIVSPHAGYIYSGPVAAYGFNYLAKENFQSYLVLAPSHRGRFKGASIIPKGIYKTPLGDAEIDSDIGERLEGREFFGFIKEAHDMEHSLEVQLPFLQAIKPDAKIVPVVIGTTDIDICMTIGETIAEEINSLGRDCGVIISTDLSHYHGYDEAVKKDKEFIQALESFEERRIKEAVSSGKCEACGEGAVIAGISLCKKIGAKKLKVVKYANSGDTAGSKDQVVGYLSALILN
ncbi:MAG: AmmeMemoRadiSam system protein B, partial [Leptospirales bacterium]|nr:AmmeMemoRadiSam system protein B [Leptospirales bacterium]